MAKAPISKYLTIRLLFPPYSDSACAITVVTVSWPRSVSSGSAWESELSLLLS